MLGYYNKCTHIHIYVYTHICICILRLKRICSNISDYEHQFEILIQSLLSRGYPYKLISEQINCASHITRTKSLTCNYNEKINEKRITYITLCHPRNTTFLQKVSKDWLNIRTDYRFNNKLSNPIILAYHLFYNSYLPIPRTPFCNVINNVTNHDVKFAHILIPDAA